MDGKEVGKEIEAAFAGIGKIAKIAGVRKNAEDVAKQGYVALRKPEAVAAFHANPDHIDWVCKFVDGEYRFFPPENKKAELLSILNNYDEYVAKHFDSDVKAVVQTEAKASVEVPAVIDTKDVVEVYKREVADLTKTTFVSISALPDNPSKCTYRLLSTDKRTGEQKIVQEFTTDFEGQFAMEIVPSIYNQVMGGLPVMDSTKGEENHRSIAFQSMEGGKRMVFSNLSDSQMALVSSMKQFVDGQYFNLEEEVSKGRHK